MSTSRSWLLSGGATLLSLGCFIYSGVVTARLNTPGESVYHQWQGQIPLADLTFLAAIAAFVLAEISWIHLARTHPRERISAILAAVCTMAAPGFFLGIVTLS